METSNVVPSERSALLTGWHAIQTQDTATSMVTQSLNTIKTKEKKNCVFQWRRRHAFSYPIIVHTRQSARERKTKNKISENYNSKFVLMLLFLRRALLLLLSSFCFILFISAVQVAYTKRNIDYTCFLFLFFGMAAATVELLSCFAVAWRRRGGGEQSQCISFFADCADTMV